MKINKNCLYCKLEFLTEKINKKYCSFECYQKSRENYSIRICPCCQKKYTINLGKRKSQKFCSTACSNTFYKTKPEIHSTRACPECQKDFIDKNNPYRKFCSKICLNLNRSKDPDISERFSKSASENMINSGSYAISPIHKSGWFETRKNIEKGKIFYRSSYELAVLNILEKDENIVSIISEPLYIEYIFKDKIKRYVPDFIITTKFNEKKIIEVKPESFIYYPINIEKFKSAEKYCENNGFKFEVWDENKITKEAIKAAKDGYIFIEKENLYCNECQKELSYSPSRPKKFCSMECLTIYRQKKKAEILKPIPCKFCSIVFKPTYRTEYYCSKECGKKSYSALRKKPLKKYICQNCNIEFEHRKKNKKFCSKICKETFTKTNKLRICIKCNEEFSAYNKEQKYCSRFCSAPDRGKERAEKFSYIASCAWCKTQFKRNISVKKENGDFCSYNCYLLFKRGGTGKYVDRKCPNCKKKFTVLWRNKKIFCSKKCSNSGKFNGMYGKHHK